MRKNTRYVGLDVHAESIAVAVAEAGRATGGPGADTVGYTFVMASCAQTRS